MMSKGLNYRFKLTDLNKYSSNLKMSDLTWKISKTALGHELNPRNCKIKKPIDKVFMKKLQDILKNTEWQNCPLYRVYKKHGRWKHESERIYREVEI